MTKFEQLLACLEQAINDHRTYGRIGNKLSEQQKSYAADEYFAKANRRIRQINTFKARLLSMYTLDTLRRLEQSRDYWQRRAYLADQENRELRARLEDLENAWAVDETIQSDRSLRPSLADTARRAAELEAENRKMRQRLKNNSHTI